MTNFEKNLRKREFSGLEKSYHHYETEKSRDLREKLTIQVCVQKLIDEVLVLVILNSTFWTTAFLGFSLLVVVF